MFLKKNLVLASLCLTALVGSLEAQTRNVFVLPTSGSSVQVYNNDSFGPVGSFGSAPAPFLVLANGPGTKYYVISKSPTNTVIVIDASNFSTLVTGRFNFGANAEAAAVSPDGKRLIVAAGKVHIIDLSTDIDLVPAGIPLTATVNDVAVGPDSTRAFLLGRADSFVTAQNRMYEVDPKTLQQRAEIALNANPGKPVYTPDGKYAIFTNQSLNTGTSLIVVDLAKHLIAKTLQGNVGSTFDQVFIVNNTSMYVTSNGTGKVYLLSIPDLSGVEANFANGPITGVLAAGSSNEVPL